MSKRGFVETYYEVVYRGYSEEQWMRRATRIPYHKRKQIYDNGHIVEDVDENGELRKYLSIPGKWEPGRPNVVSSSRLFEIAHDNESPC